MNLNISSLQYVVFDWDNTLAETRTALVKSINQVLSDYDMDKLDSDNKKHDPDLSFRDNFPNFFGDRAKEAYAHYEEIYLKEMPSLISIFENAKKTLNFFQERKIPIIIMSNKSKRLLDIEVPLLLDASMFIRIIGGHEARKDKPHPDHLHHALNGLLKPEEITPEKVWLIGDSPQDSSCAISANATPIRIGEPIWNDKEKLSPKIIYFENFKTFYENIKQL